MSYNYSWYPEQWENLYTDEYQSQYDQQYATTYYTISFMPMYSYPFASHMQISYPFTPQSPEVVEEHKAVKHAPPLRIPPKSQNPITASRPPEFAPTPSYFDDSSFNVNSPTRPPVIPSSWPERDTEPPMSESTMPAVTAPSEEPYRSEAKSVPAKIHLPGAKRKVQKTSVLQRKIILPTKWKKPSSGPPNVKHR